VIAAGLPGLVERPPASLDVLFGHARERSRSSLCDGSVEQQLRHSHFDEGHHSSVSRLVAQASERRWRDSLPRPGQSSKLMLLIAAVVLEKRPPLLRARRIHGAMVNDSIENDASKRRRNRDHSRFEQRLARARMTEPAGERIEPNAVVCDARISESIIPEPMIPSLHDDLVIVHHNRTNIADRPHAHAVTIDLRNVHKRCGVVPSAPLVELSREADAT
jgi:hypothetical protein